MLDILLIEDDKVDQKSILRALEKSDLKARITAAKSGVEGIKKARKENFDCILLDFRLPDMDGQEFLEKLKNPDQANLSPVIVLTGMEFETIAVRVLRAGAEDFLEKNHLSPARLSHTIQGAIERHQLQHRNREMLEELSNRTHFYEVVNNTMSDGLLVTDEDGVIISANRACQKIFGYRNRELLGKKGTILMQKEEAKKHDSRLKQYLKTKKSDVIGKGPKAVIGRQKDGKEIHLQIAINPTEEKGKTLFIASLSDITEQRQAEEGRKKAEHLYKILAENTSDIVILEDADCRIQYISPSVKNHLSYGFGELVGEISWDLVHPQDKAKEKENWEETVFGQKKSCLWEFRFRHKKGHYLWFESSCSPILDDNKKVIGIVSSIRNISERKEAEAKVAESEKTFRMLTEYATDIISRRDAEGKLLYISPSIKTHLGFVPEQFLGKFGWNLTHPDDDETYKAWRKTVYNKGGEFQSRVRLKNTQGNYLWFDMVSQPIKDEKGKVISVVTAARNIDEQKKTEEKIRQSQKMQAVGNLTGGIAHDFNNLLTAILGSLDYLKMTQKDLSREALDLIEIAVKSGQKGADLTRRLLAISRKQDLKPSVFGIKTLIENLMPLLKRTISENIEIQFQAPKKEIFIKVDEGELENSLSNLAVNARDAMPEGGELIFEVSRKKLSQTKSSLKDLEPGNYAVIAVSDTGEGMSREVSEQIFEPFYTTKEVDKGTGLGLSMVYSFIEQSGGHINVYSEKGKGTTFKVYLKETKRSKATKKEKPKKASLSKKDSGSVLLVEDDKEVRDFVTRALKAKGYTVIGAGDGPQAVKIINQKKNFDLLLTDMVLPKEMTGVDIAKKFRKKNPESGIIYTSGYTQKAIENNDYLKEGEKVLSKPYDLEVLLSWVREKIKQG